MKGVEEVLASVDARHHAQDSVVAVVTHGVVLVPLWTRPRDQATIEQLHRRRVWLLALVVCFLGTAPAPCSAGKKRLSREARAHLKVGLAHLDKAEFDQATEELKIAYSLSNDADILFDIGRAYEGKQDRAQALYYYQTFLEQAPAKDKKRAEAEQRVAALNAETGPPPEPKPKPKPNPEPHPKAQPKPRPHPDAILRPPPPEPPAHGGGGRGLRVTGLVLVGAGMVAAGAGGYFAWVAHDKEGQISDLFDSGAQWDSRYDDLYDQGRSARRNARILIGAGGAAVVTGTVLYVIGRRHAGGGVEVSAGGGGAGMSWSCAW
jgi:tetratricopeptide (TPR) repeat protein